ncbi:MAG: DUF4197 domain-containing protein [Lentisphaeraceae bacterium]|nr:DUF4197 domain-containing protein [Lentisphaeraceae bacterium]
MKKFFTIPICALLLTSCGNFTKRTVSSIRGAFVKKHKAKGSEEGLKEALKLGVKKATDELATYGGYGDNVENRIYFPETLSDMTEALEKAGMHKQLSELENTLNKAAELACEGAVSFFADVIRQLNVDDPEVILDGTTTAATELLRNSKFDQLHRDYLSLVRDKMGDVGSLDLYSSLLTTYRGLPDALPHKFSLEEYVTEQALDKIFFIMANTEHLIRTRPEERATALLRKTFSGQPTINGSVREPLLSSRK